MKTDELRDKYIRFFESKGHRVCPSDVLVPTWDPSVLFTPAGMNQFKDHFLGKVKLDFSRATTCQKCLRTGDIDNVGRTAYHHTFFEMLGNFSFGDYFKRDAINWAWEFLTSTRWLGLPPERLSVTVYLDDKEAAGIWADDVGLSSDRIQRMGEDDNFWPASAPTKGPDGVCGPCSEIFYKDDSGKDVEIWNLVFTQFQRVGAPPGNLRPLPSKNIDTGMGLERTAATLQGVDTNYQIDTLHPLVQAVAEVCQVDYEADSENGRRIRRITDHVRACTFCIHENVYPGANKEKYVIRRLLRRAVLDGHQIGCREPFLHQLVPVVTDIMRSPYPELQDTAVRVSQVIKQEEKAFLSTIDDGLARIERTFSEMKSKNQKIVAGETAAELYQTFGVPPELFESMAADRNFTFHWDGFRAAMEKHGMESGKSQFELFKTGPIEALKKALHSTIFLGYAQNSCESTVCGIVSLDALAETLTCNGTDIPAVIVLDKSAFYGESGGQVGDTGRLVNEHCEFEVTDTQKDGDLILHHGKLVRGSLKNGSVVSAQVDVNRRDGIRRSHSATHVLHHALQQALGSHAQQQGSKVDKDWLRFDFSNMSAVTPEQLETVQNMVTDKVKASLPIRWNTLPLAQARKAGAMMLFGEKYPDPVRMVSMGEFSKELCGGTHLDNTNAIEAFELISEEGVSAGTRRIVALTGSRAREHFDQTLAALKKSAEILNVPIESILESTVDLMKSVRDLKKQLSGRSKSTTLPNANRGHVRSDQLSPRLVKATLRELAKSLNVSPFDVPKRLATLKTEVEELQSQLAEREHSGVLSPKTLLENAEKVNAVSLVITQTPATGPNLMRQWIDRLRKTASPCAVMLGTSEGDDKVVLVAGLSRDLVEKGISAGNWVKDIAPLVGGGGGGKPDMAQAGGKQPEQLSIALEQAKHWMREQLERINN